MREKRTNEVGDVRHVGAAHQPRSVTSEVLDRMEAEGFRPALLALMNRTGEVQVATADDIEVRYFIRYLHNDWLSRLDVHCERLLGN